MCRRQPTNSTGGQEQGDGALSVSPTSTSWRRPGATPNSMLRSEPRTWYLLMARLSPGRCARSAVEPARGLREANSSTKSAVALPDAIGISSSAVLRMSFWDSKPGSRRATPALWFADISLRRSVSFGRTSRLLSARQLTSPTLTSSGWDSALPNRSYGWRECGLTSTHPCLLVLGQLSTLPPVRSVGRPSGCSDAVSNGCTGCQASRLGCGGAISGRTRHSPRPSL